MATIDRDGAFSDFSGVDRVLLNAGPDGLTLVIGGRTRRLDPLSVVAFAGEAAVTSTAVHRPTQALNLMLRRHRASGTLRSLGIDGPTVFKAADDEVVVVVVLSGAVRVDEHDLVVHDAVQASGQSVAVTGSGVVAIARIVL